MEEPLLKIIGLNKTFGKRKVLKNINFEIYPKEILGVIGESGVGKTTLLNAIVGFIKPEKGDILFRQLDVISNGKNAVYKSVYKNQSKFKDIYGFAAQSPSFYEKLTVRENLEYFGKLYKLSKETLKSNIATLLKLMNLEEYKDTLGKSLSGGMERRLDIACSLIHNPKLLLLDEPTADLDPVLRNNIWKLISKIASSGTTIILSSHYLADLEDLCSRIAIIKDGEVIDIDTPEALKIKFDSDNMIVVKTYPGNYEKLALSISNKMKKVIKNCQKERLGLVIKCTKPNLILDEVIKTIEKDNENIIEIKIVKPTLDEVFIALNENSAK
ncbi:MAG TPA: ABC transporter ATP-binding protein [Candidatus Woesearchaeota archaeon]|jgi:ABC-2 type transport system ATP-binding protein|nr:ABC transporter ATP-binding protein [Candidatus Woesearchaeota archaeon]